MKNKMSKGEKKVSNLLKANHINFKQEVSFKGLKGSKDFLRFDFAAFKNGKVWFLLEIDGKQHYEYIPYFHKNYLNFKKQMEYDIKKNKFCLVNQIPLLRIPYWALDNLTFNDIFNTDFLVKNKYHLLNQKRGENE